MRQSVRSYIPVVSQQQLGLGLDTDIGPAIPDPRQQAEILRAVPFLPSRSLETTSRQDRHVSSVLGRMVEFAIP